MILDNITISNFGIFHGEQSVNLTPPSEKKPIVLVGGLNGVGKTTLLEAIQFVLYGKFSPIVRNKNIGYEEYLKNRINKNVNPKLGAFVELTFRSYEDGIEKIYTLRRSFAKSSSRISENLDIYINGEYSSFFSDSWQEQVDRFVPTQLAHLFFFDGEQIEMLAESTHSNKLFQTAINALFGVDLVEQLKVDLAILQRNKQKKLKQQKEIQEIDSLQKEIEKKDKDVSNKYQEMASLNTKIGRVEKGLSDLNIKFSQQGGELYECRHEYEQKKKENEKQKEELDKQLIIKASGALPLNLVSNLLQNIRRQIDQELEAQQAKVLVNHLTNRKESLLSKLKKEKVDIETIKLVKEELLKDINKTEQSSKINVYLDADEKTKFKIDVLLGKELQQESQNVKSILKQAERFSRTIDQYNQKLAAVPDEDALAQIVEEKSKTEKDLEKLNIQYQEINQDYERLSRERDEKKRLLDKKYNDNWQVEIGRSDMERVIKHSQRLQKTMNVFKEKVIARNAEKLSKFILESYNQLLRKRAFINQIEIDPQDYCLSLYNGNNQEIKADDLSAGERQLLAISMLWALGRASGKPIPVIIDTPLGRLDASHRMHLVERYFPFASHQVILLSTDEEINNKYHEHLKKWIGHTYLLEYDESKQTSSIKKNYFW